MTNLIAKQTASDLTQAEAIMQAKDGVAAGFEYLYKAHCRRVYSLCLRMIKNPAGARISRNASDTSQLLVTPREYLRNTTFGSTKSCIGLF